MSRHFRPWKIDQTQLLPSAVVDYVPADHLAQFVVALAREHVDLSEIVASYKSGLGQPPFDPRMMTALLLYAYCSGLYSSRRIAKACAERVDFMMIVAHDAPDFRTIADFRKRHLPALGRLFLQVLKLAEKAGLAKLGHVALDGTKIKANASKHKAMSYERMKTRETELRAEVDRWLEAAAAADAQEDKLHGASRRGDEMPGWIADNRSAWPKSARPDRRLRRKPQLPRRRKPKPNARRRRNARRRTASARVLALATRKIHAYVATGRAKHPAETTRKVGGERTQKMRQKLKRAGYRSRYRLRKQMVEPVFGQIKQARGFRQFLLRGLEAVQAEWALICTAHNITKLGKAI